MDSLKGKLSSWISAPKAGLLQFQWHGTAQFHCPLNFSRMFPFLLFVSFLFSKAALFQAFHLVYHGENTDDFQVQARQISVYTYTQKNTAVSLGKPRSSSYGMRKWSGKSPKPVQRKLIQRARQQYQQFCLTGMRGMQIREPGLPATRQAGRQKENGAPLAPSAQTTLQLL